MIKKVHRTGEGVLPEHYVNLCARRYAAKCRKLFLAATEHERDQIKTHLSYILDGGLLEYQRESERRMRRYPDDLRKVLVEKDGGTISLRAISREESELLRYSFAIPAFPSIDDLSSIEMSALADMFEGWAQSDRADQVNTARFCGWADGFRNLVEVIGPDHLPPEKSPDARVSLLKFMALQMFRQDPRQDQH